MTIFHFIRLNEWLKAQERNRYEPHSLMTDGFIHCCTQTQINGLAKRLFNGQNDLLLLEIDVDLVKEPIIYEDLYELNQLFPHLYGALNLGAIKGIFHVVSIVDDNAVLNSYVPCKADVQR
jgi:uncharacterized protein (DUF952 family)